jgi:ribosome maturation factor RimP
VYRDIPEDLRELIEPVVEDHGCELMDVERVTTPGSALLRITVDTPAGDGRVPVDRLAAVSREVATQLDAAGNMPGSYRLEVSSPGLDRMLAREKDFVAARGMEIKLKTQRPLAGRRNFRGRLVDFVDGVARVVVDGEEREVPFEEVEKANTIYTFSSADFHGGNCRRAAE